MDDDGVARLLRQWGDALSVADAFEPRLQMVPWQQPGTVLTVFSAKDGCGTTTLASNLAVTLADGGRRQVCLVDLDLFFGDVATALGLFPRHTLADAVPVQDGLDQAALRRLLTLHSSGLAVLAAPSEPSAVESIPPILVDRILLLLRERFDYVVVDTPPAFDDRTLAAFDRSDLLVLVATADVPTVKNLRQTMETLDVLGFPRARSRVVLNRADSKVGFTAAEVEKALRRPVSLQVPSSRAVPESIARGVPVTLDHPEHPVSRSIRAFVDRHLSGDGGPPGPEPPPEAVPPHRRHR